MCDVRCAMSDGRAEDSGSEEWEVDSEDLKTWWFSRLRWSGRGWWWVAVR